MLHRPSLWDNYGTLRITWGWKSQKILRWWKSLIWAMKLYKSRSKNQSMKVVAGIWVAKAWIKCQSKTISPRSKWTKVFWILSLMAPPLNVDGCEANIDCMTFGREDYFLSSSAGGGGEPDQDQAMLHLPRLFPPCVCNCVQPSMLSCHHSQSVGDQGDWNN